MVVDWYTHIENCINNTQLNYGFHATAYEKDYQHKLIVKTLTKQGYGVQAIINWFALAGMVIDESTVEDLLQCSQKMYLPTKHNFRIWVTKHEIEYIDHLDILREVKCYLLAMVCYCKMMIIRTKKPDCSSRAYPYIYYLGTGKDDYSSNHAEYIQKEMRKLQRQGVYKPAQDLTTKNKYGGMRGAKKEKIYHNVIRASWIDWEAINGYEITDLDSQVLTLCNMSFGPDTKYCAKCGTVFLITSKTKRRLCDECMKDKARQSRRKEPVECNCSNCGSIFVKTGNTKRDLCLICYNNRRKEQIKAVKQNKSTKKQEFV